MSDLVAPRIHVLIAREAPTALVIRRGPAKAVCTFSWDRKNDLLTLAQWLRGRIYERRADISPDGRHWIYFAMNGRWSGPAKGSWTAVASAPWLKARVLYPKGDCWQGGGLFLDNKRYWVNGGGCHGVAESAGTGLRHDDTYTPPAWYGGECLTGYFNRLQRDGWTMTSSQAGRTPHYHTVFERELDHGWTLQKICKVRTGREQGRAVYYDEHGLINRRDNMLEFPTWEWADWVDGALVYAEAGFLYRRHLKSATRLGEAKLIHDFTPYAFEARPAPY